jgi:hypothetical protein
MALLDMFDGMNIFGARPNEALTGLLEKDPNALEKLKNQSLMSGLLNAGATYLAQPKNQNIGLGAILGKTYLGGMQGAQGAYDAALKSKVDAYNLAKTQKQIQMEGAPDIQKLMMWRDSLKTDSPTYDKDLASVNAEIAKVSTHAPPMAQVNVNTNVPFKEKIQENMATKLINNADVLQNAPATIDSLRQAKTLAQGNKFIGSFGEQKANIAQFFNNSFGTKIDPQGVADAKTLGSVLFASVMENLKKMDATPSENQQKQMREAFGNINTDPNALPQILDFWENQLTTKVNLHNQRVNSLAPNIKSAIPYDITVKIPKAPVKGATQNQNQLFQSADDIINKR